MFSLHAVYIYCNTNLNIHALYITDVQNEAPDQSQSDLGYGSQISPTPTGSELMDTSLTLPPPASVKPLFELKDGHTISRLIINNIITFYILMHLQRHLTMCLTL